MYKITYFENILYSRHNFRHFSYLISNAYNSTARCIILMSGPWKRNLGLERLLNKAVQIENSRIGFQIHMYVILFPLYTYIVSSVTSPIFTIRNYSITAGIV